MLQDCCDGDTDTKAHTVGLVKLEIAIWGSVTMKNYDSYFENFIIK